MKIPIYIVEARARLMVKAVFFSSILYDRCRLKLIPEGESSWSGIDCDTAMTDGLNIVMNLDFMKKLSVDERVFVFAHEVYHVMAMHPKRMRQYATTGLFNLAFLPELYNIAADAAINKVLVTSSIGKRPEGTVWIEKIPQQGQPDYVVTGMETAEEIYKLLLDLLPPQARKALQQGDASGAGGAAKGIPGAGDGLLSHDIVPVSTDAEAEHVNEAEMRAAIQSAQTQAKSQGTMPAGLKRFIDDFLEPQVSWAEKIRMSVVKAAGKDRTNWARPNKRKLVSPGVYMPKKVGLHAPPVAVAIDTSGSVSETELRQYMGELSSVLGDVKPSKVWLMWCDAAVDGVVELVDPEDLKTAAKVASGGGGTSFIPPFAYMRDEGIRADTFIYFTDGYGPFPSPEIVDEAGVQDLIWCISSNVVAPLGETIKITY